MGITRALIGGIATIGIAAGVVALPQTASAANDGLPDGSWRQSCERPYVQNGTLFCESTSGGSNVAYRWEGSFSRSCRDVSTDSNGNLTATCQTMNGNWNRTGLSPRQCGSYRAGNRDGVLFCEQ